MTIKKKIIDELLKGYSKPEEITGQDGLLKQLIIDRKFYNFLC